MKLKNLCISLITLLAGGVQMIVHADTQTTAFTYQGQLNASGGYPTASFQFTFTLFDASEAGNQIGAPVSENLQVINGLFTTDLDFGAVFNGQQYWLEISVNGQVLAGRQRVNSVPVANFALHGTVPVTGQFLPTQLVAGAVVTCASTNVSANLATCNTMLVDGISAYLGSQAANLICNAVTGKSYNGANGQGTIQPPYFNASSSGWTLATSGSVSPMQNLTCNR